MKQYCIQGRVVNRVNQRGIKNLLIEAWDKDLIINDLVGSTKSDKAGTFKIQFDESYFKEQFLDRCPDLFLKIYHGNDLIKTTEDSILWNVDQKDIEIVIEIDDPSTESTSSELIWDEIIEYLHEGLLKRIKYPTILDQQKALIDKKLARIAGQQQFKDVIMPALVHYVKRYLLWQEKPDAVKPIDETEELMFEVLTASLKDEDIGLDTLELIVKRFDTIKDKHKKRFFHKDYITVKGEEGIDSKKMFEDITLELIEAVHFEGFVKWLCPSGKLRQVVDLKSDSEFPIKLKPKVKLWEINEIRGANMEPSLKLSDYKEEEIAQECKYETVKKGNQVEIKKTCTKKKYIPPLCLCDGEHIGNICLRIPEIAVGENVKLVGVNFYDENCLVKLSLKKDPSISVTFKCVVCGDMQTPVEDKNGYLIDDSRVRDEISFYIDPDTWTSMEMIAGIYNMQVMVPNSINWSSNINKKKPKYFYSNPRPIYVSAMPGDYKVWIEELYCEKITDGRGSDEVGIILFGSEIDPKGGVQTWQKVEDEFNNSDLSDVDEGDKAKFDNLFLVGSPNTYARIGTDILVSNIYMIGYEIDDGDAYKNQIKKAWETYTKLWTNISATMIFSITGGLVSTATFFTWISSLKGGLIGFAITMLKSLFTFFWASYAPPDLIMKDLVTLSPSNLDYMTHPNTQIPMDRQFTMDNINVHVQPQSNKVVDTKKAYVEFTEKRKYHSKDEGSVYWLTIKYRRKIS